MSGKNNNFSFSPKRNAKMFNAEKYTEMMLNELESYLARSSSVKQDIMQRIKLEHAQGIFRQRRKEALLRLLPVVTEKCSPTSEKLNKDSMSLLFITSELLPVHDYNSLDLLMDLRLGAVIWILDNLKRAGNLEKALKQLSNMDIRKGYTPFPKNFYHPCYSIALLDTMMYVTSTRFETSEPGQKSEREDNLFFENIILTGNAERREYNTNFQKIIDLLPQEAIQSVCREFRNKVLEMCSIFFKGYSFLDKKYYSNAGYLLQVELGSHNLFDSNTHHAVGPVSSFQPEISLESLSLLSQTSNNHSEFTFMPTSGFLGNTFDEKVNNLKILIGKTKKALKSYSSVFHSLFSYDQKQLQDFFDNKDIEELFLNYSLSNPLGMCFALIYLTDHGDDYPWLFHSGGCVMNEVKHTLPWGYGKKEDISKGSRYHTIRYQPFDFVPEGWLDKDFDTIDYYSRRDGDRNLAQILYGLTGCIAPSGIPNPFDRRIKELANLNLSPFETGFASGAAYSMYLSSQQAKLPIELNTESDNMPSNTGYDYECSYDKLSDRHKAILERLSNKLFETYKNNRELQKELLQTKSEIKNLKRSAFEEKKKYTEDILQKNKELDKAKLEHIELIDLRKLTFSSLNSDSSVDSTNDDINISLPYETRKQVVIFGGRANFIKQMKNFLPNVRYVDVNNYSFNPDIVRNADVIWIQNNYISHSQYWKAVNEARQYNVQVRYFTFSSPDKSALQVVKDDIFQA